MIESKHYTTTTNVDGSIPAARRQAWRHVHTYTSYLDGVRIAYRLYTIRFFNTTYITHKYMWFVKESYRKYYIAY